MRKTRKTLPRLTVKYLLDNVSQEEIFSAYFGIPINDISKITNTNKKISAPYREDKTPSLGFMYRPNGKLSARDFGGYFWGDCFDCVAFVLGLNPNNPADFGKIMEDITKTFKIHKYRDSDTDVKRVKKSIKLKEKSTLRIEIRQRGWIDKDAYYWYNRYGITRTILRKNKVFPIGYLYFNGNCVYEYDINDLSYGYYLGTRDKIKYWKIYFPFRRGTGRWYANGSMVQGIHTIKNSDFGVITKSLKDVMVLQSLNVQAIAPASETTPFTKEQINYIKSKWKFIVSLMDFDKAGRDMARILRRNNIPSLFLTNGDYDTFDFGAKDISDYNATYGRKQTLELKNIIVENDFEIDQKFYNLIMQLKHR
jgi:hypothetical protein